MPRRIDGKLNQLDRSLPEGLLVDASWLRKHGYSTSLRSQYVTAGWLEQPAHRVYRRPRGSLSWQQVVISLQTLLDFPILVGGRTALELHGFAHYLTQAAPAVHLYGRKPPPKWVYALPLDARFVFHNDRRLFRSEPVTRGLTSLTWNVKMSEGASNDPVHAGFTRQPWGQWDWPLTLSTPERAVLELLDELPARESFHQVDKLIEGLSTLSPRRLQKLLADCRNVKVKRLFFFFADRHNHAWLKQLNKADVDLGSGKRSIIKGGKLDRAYQITVPEDLDGVQ
jgi:hypothetical protein